MSDVAYCVIQEGGTSEELYLTVFDDNQSAIDYQKDCEQDGSYRTSQILEIPAAIADTAGFWDIANALVSLHLTIEYQSERDNE